MTEQYVMLHSILVYNFYHFRLESGIFNVVMKKKYCEVMEQM